MKKLNWFARPEKFKNRLIMVILGVILMGFGLSMIIEVHFGTDPCSAFNQGLTTHFPISFGTAQLFLNLVFFVVVIFKSPDKIGYGTIANMVFVGYISDFFRFIYSKLLPADFFTGFAVRVGVLIPALIIFIFGAAMYMTAGLGTAPYDAMPYIISEHLTKIPFKYIRMTWDIVFMALGWLAGGNIGVVTIVVAFFLGPVIAWEQKKLAVFIS
mgnify:CR=1 FL=1